jgi:hypothetical protein
MNEPLVYVPLWPTLKPLFEAKQPRRTLPEPNGDGWIGPVCCPWRDDAHPSLSLRPDSETSPGAWRDHATGETGSMADAAQRLGVDPRISSNGHKDASEPPLTLAGFAQKRHLEQRHLEGRWRVRQVTHKNRPALRFPTTAGVDRVKYLDGAKPKSDWAARGGRMHWYGLAGARGLSGPLYIVNGEPSVWAAQQAGVAAVCLCAGEGTAPTPELVRELAEAIGGRPVRVVYDCDEAGHRGGPAVAAAIRAGGIADCLALALPAHLGAGGDVDDLHRWVGDEGLAAALADLVPLGDTGAGAAATSEVPRWHEHFRPVDAVLADTSPAIDYLIPGILPRGWAGLVAGETKVGKTLFVLGAAEAVATGGLFLGRPAQQGGVVLALADDPPILSRKRLQSLAGCSNVYVSLERWTPEVAAALTAAVKDLKPALVVVDTLVKTVSSTRGDENDSSTMDRIIEQFVTYTTNEETTVLLIHHLNKGGGVRGSTAIAGALPFELRLSRVGDETEGADEDDLDEDEEQEKLVKLSVEWKLEPIEPLILRYRDGIWQHMGTETEVAADKLATRALKALDDKPGQTSDDLARALKVRRSRLDKVLKALAGDGRARLEIVPTGGKGKPRNCWHSTRGIKRPYMPSENGTDNSGPFSSGESDDGAIIRPEGGTDNPLAQQPGPTVPLSVLHTGTDNPHETQSTSGGEAVIFRPESERLYGTEYAESAEADAALAFLAELQAARTLKALDFSWRCITTGQQYRALTPEAQQGLHATYRACSSQLAAGAQQP